MKKRKKVAVIDDTQMIRVVLQKALSQRGYEVLTYPHCEELMSSFLNAPPDLIILDLMLPWQSGEVFLKRIKEIQKLKHIPVIVITGKAMTDEAVERLKQIGADRFLAKPFEIAQLANMVNELINKGRLHAD